VSLRSAGPGRIIAGRYTGASSGAPSQASPFGWRDNETAVRHTPGPTAALRRLVFWWMWILYRCWQNCTAKDEATSLNALKRRGPPRLTCCRHPQCRLDGPPPGVGEVAMLAQLRDPPAVISAGNCLATRVDTARPTPTTRMWSRLAASPLMMLSVRRTSRDNRGRGRRVPGPLWPGPPCGRGPCRPLRRRGPAPCRPRSAPAARGSGRGRR
jgi:hypothetical protein